jgi:hypothetical protein
MDDRRAELTPTSVAEVREGGPRRGASLPISIAALLLATAALGGCARQGDAARAELRTTFRSPEATAEAFLEALAVEDRLRIETLALDEDEFRDVVWPELPSSRPERNVPFEYGWGDLHKKSRNALSFTLARYGGQSFDLEEVLFKGETTDYETFRVHREAWLVVRNVEGRRGRVQLFGSMIERDGRYKLFSFVTD